MAHYDLANIRRQCGITQRDLANRMGTSLNKIQYSESGQGSMSYSSLIKLSLGAQQTDFDDEPVIFWNGEALYEARKSLKLSQKQLAEIVGSDFRDVSRWETGRNEPRPDMVECLAKACGKSVSCFYTGSVSQKSISGILSEVTKHVFTETLYIETNSRHGIIIDFRVKIRSVISYAA